MLLYIRSAPWEVYVWKKGKILCSVTHPWKNSVTLYSFGDPSSHNVKLWLATSWQSIWLPTPAMPRYMYYTMCCYRSQDDKPSKVLSKYILFQLFPWPLMSHTSHLVLQHLFQYPSSETKLAVTLMSKKMNQRLISN